MNVVGIIPARWGSTRFPGKPLALIAGKPLLQHVWERVMESTLLDQVIVATDDMRIAEAAFGFGAEVAVTRDDHPSGTDRLAEVVKNLPEAEGIINIQGDEPLIDPLLIDRLARVLALKKAPDMVTAASPLTDAILLDDPNVVKVVLNRAAEALYFSRSRIPFSRQTVEGGSVLRHHGIYGYQRKFLLRFVRWPQGILEQTEQLEQLRALENGGRIRVLISNHDSPGVDTPADVAVIEAKLSLVS